jgi:hypothetical protein
MRMPKLCPQAPTPAADPEALQQQTQVRLEQQQQSQLPLLSALRHAGAVGAAASSRTLHHQARPPQLLLQLAVLLS